MWIVCCGMKRSGSTLQYQITSNIAEKHMAARRIPWVPEEELVLAEHSEGTYLYKCHCCHSTISEMLSHSTSKGLYTYRDIREVCASWIRKNNTSFERMWSSGFINESLEQYEVFTQYTNMLVSRYEDFFFDLENEVIRISKHLGVCIEQYEVTTIAESHNLEAQKIRVNNIHSSNLETFTYGKQVIDQTSLLHSNHITAGTTDSWKREFSKLQIALIEYQAHDWMVKKGYELLEPKLSFFDNRRKKKIIEEFNCSNGE